VTAAKGKAVKIERITGRIGAEVTGIDISQSLDGETVATLRSTIDDHAVLVFTGQAKLSQDEQLRFATYFGDIHIPEFRTPTSTRDEVTILDQVAPKGQGADVWHSDSTFLEAPPRQSTLQAQIMPTPGGDTCFASMYAAYDALSPELKRFLAGLTASHSPIALIERTRDKAGYTVDTSLEVRPPFSHPVVAVNPVTGRPFLFVNSSWVIAIDGLTKAESDHWLKFLFEHIKSPEFQMRHHWVEGDLVLWDGHAVQHFAVPDYSSRRVMQRVLTEGQRPIGIADVAAGSLVAALA
jgi:taurine dioxygenase